MGHRFRRDDGEGADDDAGADDAGRGDNATNDALTAAGFVGFRVTAKQGGAAANAARA